MDSLFCEYKKQKLIPEPKKSETGHSSQYFPSSFQRSLIKVKLICEGNLHEPNFPRRLKTIVKKLKILVSNDKKPLKVTKVEPWNSVRVTLNLPNDAAQRLRQLAEHGDENLRELGILSVQLEGQQVISLRLSNQSSTSSAGLTCNIDSANNNTSNATHSQNTKETSNLKDSSSAENFLFGQVNGTIEDDSNSSNNGYHEHSQPSSDRSSFSSFSKNCPSQLETSNQDNDSSNSSQSLPPPSIPPLPPPYVGTQLQQQKVFISQTTNNNRASNSLLLPSSRQVVSSPVNASTDKSNVQEKKVEPTPGVASSSVNIPHLTVQPIQHLQITSLPSNDSMMPSDNTNQQFSNSQSTGFGSHIRNGQPSHFNGPSPHMIHSTSLVSSQQSVPQTSNLQSLTQPVKQAETVSHSSNSVIESTVKPPQQSYDHNANYVNSSSTNTPSTLSLYQPSTNTSLQQANQSSEPGKKLQSSHTDAPTVLVNEQTNSSSDILDSSVDAVDDEELLASVSGSNSMVDFNSFTDDDLNLLLEMEIDPSNQPPAASSLNIVNTTTVNSPSGFSQHATASSTTQSSSKPGKVTSAVTQVSTTVEEFRSPNVVAPQSTQSMPFFIAQKQQQQQVSSKIGTPVMTSGQAILVNSSSGAVLNQSQSQQQQHQSQQMVPSTTATTSMPQSALYPFTSMQHASLFTNKQQQQQQQQHHPQTSPQPPSSPRHIIVPVRQIPAVRAATTQQVSTPPPPTLQPQSIPIVRTMQPTTVTSSGGTELILQNNPAQSNIYGSINTQPNPQLVRQQLPVSSNSSIPVPNKPQQIVIRQNVPYSATQQVTNSSNSAQQNAVALSSPLLVNLLQSDVQPSNSHQPQQHQQFVTQSGTQQIRLIAPSGTHNDGTPVMMMVRVSSAPQGGQTTQLIHPATGNIVATVPSSQVTTINSSPVIEQQVSQANQQPSTDSTSAPSAKPKKPRKSRSKKNQSENGKSESSVQTSMATVQPATSSGAITSIPLSLATSSSSRLQSSPVSTILTFPTSSMAQTLKLQTTASSPQQTLLTSQTGQHLFNQKRVQPVVMITSTNPNLLSQVSTSSSDVIVSNPAVSSAGAFILTNVAASSFSGNTTSTTTTTGVQLSGNRKQIFLATKSNSFPVSSALSAGAFVARLTNNPSSPSSQSLISSPVKFVSQAGSSSVPISPSTSNSLTLPTGDHSFTNLSIKSSLANVVTSNVQQTVSSISINTTNNETLALSRSITAVSNSSASPIVTSHIQALPVVSSPTITNVPFVNKFQNSNLPSDPISLNSSQVLVTATKSATPTVSISPESITKNIVIPLSVSATVPSNNVLLNKLTPSNASILAAPKVLSSASSVSTFVSQFSGNPTSKPFISSVSQPTNQQLLPLKSVNDLRDINNDNAFIVKNTENLANLFNTETQPKKQESLETFLSSTINETKLLDDTKAETKPDFKFNLALAGVLEEGSSKLDSDFLSCDDDSDRLNDDAPISPSYFLAPASAFENKSVETKEIHSVTSEPESKNLISLETTLSKGDLNNTPEISFTTSVSTSENVLPESSKQTNSLNLPSQTSSVSVTESTTAGSSEQPTNLTPTNQLTTETTTPTTVISTDIKTSTNNFTTSTTTKSNETTPSKSKSFESFSYFLSKHSYSQDLPDHILEDDDDDSDADDFGLGIYPRFLSGRIGTVSGNSNLNVSSQNNTSSTFTASKLNDTFESFSTSDIASLSETKQTDASPSESIENKQKTDTENQKSEYDHKSSLSNETEKNCTLSQNTELNSGSQSPSNQDNGLLHGIMNGDISTKIENTSNIGQVNSGIKSVCLTNENTISPTPFKQYPFASKSYPDTQSFASNLVTSDISEQTPIATGSQEITKTSITNDNKHSTTKESSVKTKTKSRKSVSSTTAKNTPTTPASAKNRRKAVTKVTNTPQTLIVSDSQFQSLNPTNTKSELHSLLASPAVSTTKTNVAIMTSITTETSSTDSISMTNSIGETAAGRPVIFTFKQPTQQTVSSTSLQPVNSQPNQPELTQSTSAPSIMKVFSSGNKLLTIGSSTTNTVGTVIPNTVNSGQGFTNISNSITSQNLIDQNQNKSQNQTISPMVGRYILASSGQQFVVVKSMNFDANNASGSNQAQLKFITATPTSKLSTVSVAGSTQPIFMMAGSSGQAILPVKANSQSTPSEPHLIGNEQQSSDNNSKKLLAKKTIFSTATNNEVFNTLSSAQQSLTSSTNVMENPDTKRTQSNTTNADSSTVDNETTKTIISDQNSNLSSSGKVFLTHSSLDNTKKQTELPELSDLSEYRFDQSVTIVSNQGQFKAISKSVVKNDQIELPTKSVNEKNSLQNLLNNPIGVSIGKPNEGNIPLSSSPVTVQLMLPATTTDSTVNSVSNIVKLRVDPSKSKETNDSFLSVKGNLNSIPVNKRPIMPKSVVTVQQQVVAQSTNPPIEATPTVFATKSSSITASKTIPAILRSKRKADTFYQHSNLGSEGQQFVNQAALDFGDSSEAETSIASNSLMTTLKPNRNFQSTNEHSLLPVDYIEESKTDFAETPKPRKRARKSKVTTLQQPIGVNELGTSLLHSDYSSLPIEIETIIPENEPKSSLLSNTPRVLRNTISTPTKAVNSGKRAPRNKNIVLQNIVTMTPTLTTISSPNTSVVPASESIILTNSISKSDKTRKLTQPISNSNKAPRQTRSNRNRNKTEPVSTNLNPTNEILITDNAVDETHLISINNPELDMISMIEIPEENSHSHLSALSGSELMMVQQQSSVPTLNQNTTILTAYSPIEQRAPSLILESGNSNSSTASSSSSNSLLQKTPRPRSRQQLSSPSPTTAATGTKPALRSSSASETLTTPITPNKRRRVANK